MVMHSQFHKAVSLKQLLNNSRAYPVVSARKKMLHGVERSVVYIVKDGNQVLYVGMTNYSARDRLLWHVHNESRLGQHIIANRPQSDSWQVEMIHFPSRSALCTAERNIIKELEPILNERQ